MSSGLDFGRDSPLVRRGHEFARRAHCGPDGDGKRLAHSLDVARILHRSGAEEEVVAAGLLHDVAEHSGATVADVERDFGPTVAALVAAMTEDASIAGYGARKSEHRARLATADERTAAIVVADKRAKVRELTRDGARPPAPQLEHYVETLRMLHEAHPGAPGLGELDRELAALLAGAASSPQFERSPGFHAGFTPG